MAELRILALDDESSIRRLLVRGLEGYGYTVVATGSVPQALDMMTGQPPDLLLLDVGLEGYPDGIEVCRQLRTWSKTPVIMLTVRDEKEMKLAALDCGADDYVTKPFDMDELEARIRAVLRRAADARTRPEVIHIGDLVVDTVNRRVTVKGEDVHLTPKEYALLKLLASNPGRVFTSGMLFDLVWGSVPAANPEHSVRVFVNTLRKKLGDDLKTTMQRRLILNEPGIGYRFADGEAESARMAYGAGNDE